MSDNERPRSNSGERGSDRGKVVSIVVLYLDFVCVLSWREFFFVLTFFFSIGYYFLTLMSIILSVHLVGGDVRNYFLSPFVKSCHWV